MRINSKFNEMLLVSLIYINFIYLKIIKSEILNDFVIVKESFNNFTQRFNRNLIHKYEAKRRFEAFQVNCKKISEHNKLYESGKSSFKLGINEMADLDSQRYLKKYLRLTSSKRSSNNDKKSISNRNTRKTSSELEKLNLPESIDWRLKGFLTPSDNQGACGSCYALSIVHSIEGQLFKRTGKIIPLSVQHILDCSIQTGNHGCFGGSLRNTLKYLELYGGLMREQDYPYQEKQGKCNFIPELAIVNVTSWNILPINDENAIQIAVATIGPISVSINASPSTFQLYEEGIYDDSSCTWQTVNHAVLVVGYTPDYWIIKNWWGEKWGENGYMKLRRGKNMCGVARYAAYAIV